MYPLDRWRRIRQTGGDLQVEAGAWVTGSPSAVKSAGVAGTHG